MDTILYFYQRRDLESPVTDFRQMQGYLLVRAAVDVGENRWFSQSLTPPEEFAEEGPLGESRWQAFWRRKKRQRLRRRQAAQYERETDRARLEIGGFLGELTSKLDERAFVSCVYDEQVRRYLVADSGRRKDVEQDEKEGSGAAFGGLKELWRRIWPFPEFDGYFQPQWAEELLPYARHFHFILLGTAPCASYVLSRCARRMKSLRWFLAQEAYTEETEEAAEAFYMEWGLPANLQLLPGKRVYARLLLETKEPVCVLDFSGEPHVPAAGLADGSVWLDFASIEGKARKFFGARQGTAYVSLKEVWKRAGKP